ncbi:MAG: lectin-like protein [Limisphaerales bacterium]
MKVIIAFLGTAILFAATFKTQADIIAGPITNPENGHDYYLLSPNTWTASEAEAESLDGTLAVIKNAKEQEWVFSTFGNYGGTNRDLWIGLHRVGPDRTLQWVTGENLDYQNWAGGQPDDAGGVEGYVDMASANKPWGFKPGGWNDAKDDAIIDNSLPFAVVELPGKAHELSLSKSERALVGDWYEGGNIERPCWITATDKALFMISNNKMASRLTFRDDGTLFVANFHDGRYNAGYDGFVPPEMPRRMNLQTRMSGEIVQDRILWSDGTWWSRKPLKK